MLITIVSFLAVIAVLIIAHELGHFITAKAFGVKIEEFGLGYPPRLFGLKRGGTIYSLNALPLGGFVKMTGEEDPKAAGSLASKGVGTRLIVLSAGSLVNALLPLILFSIALMLPHVVVNQQVVAKEVATDSPAEMAGIQTGDIFISVNGKPVNNTFDLTRYIDLNLGKEITILVEHSDLTTEEVALIPRWQPPPEQGAIGLAIDVDLANATEVVATESLPFWKAIPLGINQTIETLLLFKNAILGILLGTTELEPVGPVGIAQITGEVAKAGPSPLLEWTSIISINLAIINLLPLPALDGGRIAFVLLEWVRRGKRISPQKEGLVHMIGFVLLMGLILAITYQDIMRIISGDSPIP